MRKAFTLLELMITVAVLGIMVFSASFYIDTESMNKDNVKLNLQSHFNLITATIFQCKNLSNMFPVQADGSLASDTLVSSLECNTSTPYLLTMIPQPVSEFTPYTATQTGTEFYFSTQTTFENDKEVLEDLNSTYSTTQYELNTTGTTTTLKFYLSR